VINLKFGKPLVVTVLFAFLFFILINGYFVLDKATGLPVPQQNLTLEIEFKRQVGTTSKLNIDDIYGQINSKSSLPLQSKPVEFGTHYTYYLLKLKNLSNKKGLYTALIDNPSLDQLEVFELTNLNNPILAFNPNLEFENLTLRALPHFEIGLRANEEKQYILISQTNGSPNFPVNIFRSQDFDQYKNTVLMLWGGFITVVIVMGIYNLVLYFGNRETVYLLYIAYITLFLIVLSVLHGYGLYLFPVSIWQLLNEKIMFFYWLGISLTLFTLYFFRLQDNRSDKVVKFAKVFTFAMAILSFSALFQDEYETAKLMFPLQAIVYILCIAIVLRSLNKNHNWAKYYVISWLPLLTGAGVGSLLMLGEIEHTFWTRHATMLGMLFEMSFISLALAERIRVNEAQRLYEATHDLETHLPNQNLLRQTCYELNSKDSNARYSLLSIRISNFSEIKDFIGGEKLAPFFHDFTRVVAHELASDLTLVPMNTEGNDQPTILLTEDTICFLIQSGDLALVNKALKNLLASEAGHFKYQSIPIQFNYYIGVTVPFS
jgi:diguanylate cyclase